MKKNIKLIILITLCIAIWGALIFIFNKKEQEEKKISAPQYLLLDNNYFWKYENSNWTELTTEDDYDEFNWKKFDIYTNNKYYNTYKYVTRDGKSYYFDDDNNEFEVPQHNILLNKDTYFNLKKYTELSLDSSDSKIITNILKENNHSSDNLTIQKKYSISSNFNIYVISNYFETAEENSNIFYVVFCQINSDTYLLINKSYSDEVNSYDLAWVLDTNKKYNNIIVSYTCDTDICYDMYQYDDNKFKKVIGSAIE